MDGVLVQAGDAQSSRWYLFTQVTEDDPPVGRKTPQEVGREGFYNAIVEADALMETATAWANRIAAGPNFANAMTKNQLNTEWDMGLHTAIEAEAQAQAICMQTRDFERAYSAFVDKQRPVFEGN